MKLFPVHEDAPEGGLNVRLDDSTPPVVDDDIPVNIGPAKLVDPLTDQVTVTTSESTSAASTVNVLDDPRSSGLGLLEALEGVGGVFFRRLKV